MCGTALGMLRVRVRGEHLPIRRTTLTDLEVTPGQGLSFEAHDFTL